MIEAYFSIVLHAHLPYCREENVIKETKLIDFYKMRIEKVKNTFLLYEKNLLHYTELIKEGRKQLHRHGYGVTKSELRLFENQFSYIDETDLPVFKSEDQTDNQKKVNRVEMKKKILMLAWEYPPLLVGGLARHVFDLSRNLVSDNCEVHVITPEVHNHLNYEVMNGVHVHRVRSLQPHHEDFYHWVGSLNMAFAEYVLQLAKQIHFDVIHAHDWLVSVAAISLKQQLNIPIITTIHATEHGRNGGIYTKLQQQISKKEWELIYASSKVIVCSQFMKEEIEKVFQTPSWKIKVIPNGVDLEMLKGQSTNWKEKYGAPKDIFIFSVGRMVTEKGFQTIIDAAPILLKECPNVKFIIAGKGPLLNHYQTQVKAKNLDQNVFFIGFIEDKVRNEMFNSCDICVFPSYYEPFGIVALEGMIAGKPTIVSDTGGLREIITHKETGLTIYPKDVQSLVTQLISCIKDKELAKKIALNGQKLAETKYSWKSIANETKVVYHQIFSDDH